MLVRELIEKLGSEDPNAEVHFSYNYGDRWQTQVAPTVETVEPGLVKHSEYHQTDRLMFEEDMVEDEGDFEGTRWVVVLG